MSAAEKHSLKKLLSIMFKIGCIGFGGGTALIPVIEEEVLKEKLVDEDEFNKDVIVSNITPGALPVSIASGIGRAVCGVHGMLLAALMMALPGTLMTVIIVALIHQSGEALLQQILFASAGVTAYIVFMLIEYAKGTYKECRKNYNTKSGMFFMILVFVLTSGGELYQILGLDIKPVFDISTINILIMAFFIIFYTNGQISKVNIAVSAAVTVIYCLCVGKAGLIESDILTNMLRIAMLVLAIYGIRKGMKDQEAIPFSPQPLKQMLKEEAGWIVFLVILSLPALILYRGSLIYIGKGFLSTIMSFGGGDAYLAVASGMFVNTGMIGYEDFYSKIVSVANALPGSILCKILSGVGYVLGHTESGMLVGFAVALCGLAVSVTGSGATISVVSYLYERYEHLDIFCTIKKYIRPIVAGLLLSICVSLIYQNVSVFDSVWLKAAMLLMTVGIYVLNDFWKRREKLLPIFRVLISAAIALVICNIL